MSIRRNHREVTNLIELIELNENENTTYPNLRNAVNPVIRKNFSF